MKVAVVGASGFIGTRLVEMFCLTDAREWETVPVVRSYSSLAVLARVDLDWKVTDHFDCEALARAFAGCNAVVHAAIGDSAQIVQMAGCIYRAAEKARVRRLVVVSSASVHGQAPAPGTDESSPLHVNDSFAYNAAKARAEGALRKLHAGGTVEMVILRPAVVYGPRSRWVAGLARELLAGTAFLIDEGLGICNSIYVDNLIEAIRLALKGPTGNGEAFLVTDAQQVTWADFYKPMAEAVGIEMAEVHRVDAPVFHRSIRDRVESLTAAGLVQTFLPLVPARAKRLTKILLANWEEPARPNAWQIQPEPLPVISEEMARLQRCKWKFPITKASTVLGYKPPVSFSEGMRRSIDWLGFAGFPLKTSASSSGWIGKTATTPVEASGEPTALRGC